MIKGAGRKQPFKTLRPREKVVEKGARLVVERSSPWQAGRAKKANSREGVGPWGGGGRHWKEKERNLRKSAKGGWGAVEGVSQGGDEKTPTLEKKERGGQKKKDKSRAPKGKKGGSRRGGEGNTMHSCLRTGPGSTVGEKRGVPRPPGSFREKEGGAGNPARNRRGAHDCRTLKKKRRGV